MKSFLTASMSLLSAPAATEEMTVFCDVENGLYERVYVLDIDQKTAKRVDMADAEEGVVTELSHVYQLDFAGTQSSDPHRARLYRYTGKIEIEWGKQPFDVYSIGNVFQNGICVVSEAEKKF